MFFRSLCLALALVALPAAAPPPDYGLAAAVIQAGGGAAHFDTTTLFRALAGRLAGAELFRLRAMFGRRNVSSFLDAFQFTVQDFDRIARRDGIELPPSPPPDSKVLARALLLSGTTADGSYSVAQLMDHLLSQRIHTEVAADLDRRLGSGADANYAHILAQAIADMKRANGF